MPRARRPRGLAAMRAKCFDSLVTQHNLLVDFDRLVQLVNFDILAGGMSLIDAPRPRMTQGMPPNESWLASVP